MAVPPQRDPGAVAHRAPRGDVPSAPTTFGPTDVDAAGLAARIVNRLDVSTSGHETTTVQVRGELLQETAPAFTDVVGRLGDDRSVQRLVVDLSGTTFMDSTGLGTLVSLRNQVLVRGGQFALVRPADRVFRLFELTRLDSVFDFVDAA